ncbi:MAG: DUF86 domain-containing protein [Gammaproteobacteria bacterium]|nr:DUF86 domain-containing protein [Gammaproteobacteria bacterium]NNJ84942.1 hypothetical protein [Gammaproteobacteria bacterium]
MAIETTVRSARFFRLLILCQKQAERLRGTTERLLGECNEIDGPWISDCLGDPNFDDRLESFGAKFSRLQDMICDKLIPAFLQATGEKTGTLLDNLNRLEKFELVDNVEDWIEARGLRNRLVHEYIEDPQLLADALTEARRFSAVLFSTLGKFVTATENLAR